MTTPPDTSGPRIYLRASHLRTVMQGLPAGLWRKDLQPASVPIDGNILIAGDHGMGTTTLMQVLFAGALESSDVAIWAIDFVPIPGPFADWTATTMEDALELVRNVRARIKARGTGFTVTPTTPALLVFIDMTCLRQAGHAVMCDWIRGIAEPAPAAGVCLVVNVGKHIDNFKRLNMDHFGARILLAPGDLKAATDMFGRDNFEPPTTTMRRPGTGLLQPGFGKPATGFDGFIIHPRLLQQIAEDTQGWRPELEMVRLDNPRAGLADVAPVRDLRQDVQVGDTVLIRGEVKQIVPGVGVVVELFSKTDQYQAWIREDLVEMVVLPTPTTEPGDGTWLFGRPTDGREHAGVFYRNDSQAPADDGRRWPKRWRDVEAGQWVGWPVALERGADPSQRLTR